MPAKAPMYLKASGKNGAGHKGSKKLRELLSADMISPPLGDFRHMAHVGQGGTEDMFGDTSFLQKGSNTENATGSNFRRGGSLGKKEKGSKKGRSLSHEQSATLDRFKRSKSSSDKHGPTNGTTSGSEQLSPVLQSAFSLPILSNNEISPAKHNEDSNSNEITNPPQTSHKSNDNIANEKQKVYSRSHENMRTTTPPETSATTTTTPTHKTSNGITGGPPKPRRIMSIKTENPNKPETELEPPILNHAEKLSPLRRSSEVLSEMPEFVRKNPNSEQTDDDSWSFSLDLGPSLMDEIMGMLDEPQNTP